MWQTLIYSNSNAKYTPRIQLILLKCRKIECENSDLVIYFFLSSFFSFEDNSKTVVWIWTICTSNDWSNTVEPETIAGENFGEFRGIAAFCESFFANFCAGDRRVCGRQCAKVLFAKCATLTNSQKFPPAKVFGYTLSEICVFAVSFRYAISSVLACTTSKLKQVFFRGVQEGISPPLKRFCPAENFFAPPPWALGKLI